MHRPYGIHLYVFHNLKTSTPLTHGVAGLEAVSGCRNTRVDQGDDGGVDRLQRERGHVHERRGREREEAVWFGVDGILTAA